MKVIIATLLVLSAGSVNAATLSYRSSNATKHNPSYVSSFSPYYAIQVNAAARRSEQQPARRYAAPDYSPMPLFSGLGNTQPAAATGPQIIVNPFCK